MYFHKKKNKACDHSYQGATHSLFECTNDSNEYLIPGDYMSDFNNSKSLYHQLHIALDDFSKLRFQTFFIKI